jgi:hypothetical protein
MTRVKSSEVDGLRTTPRRFPNATDCPLRQPQRAAIALVRDPHIVRWLAHELQDAGASLHLSESLADAAALLTPSTTPTPQIAVVALDELSTQQLRELKRLRDTGWRGQLIGISRGGMPSPLRRALGLDRLLTPPFVQDLFGDLFAELARRATADAHHRSAAPAAPSTYDVEAASRMTTGSSSRYTATPEDSTVQSIE